MRDLYALVGRTLLGVFHETADGAVFEYAASDLTTPLSLSLPRGRALHPQVGINYLDNLLPDRADVRARWARTRNLASSDTFSLATAYGEDVAGAVTLTPDPDRPRAAERPLVEATEDDIASRIASIRQDDTSWIDPQVKPRMSLAGAQGKFSLARIGDRWYWPTYDRPSTHIFKPPAPKHRDIETFEALGLDLARSVGVEAAAGRRMTWLGQSCFVVERFDRDANGQRIPAEDINQALGRPAAAKYAATAAEVARLMAVHGSERRFVRQLAFNVAFGNGDAHAKNYSFLLAGDRAVLAPIYDTVPTTLYPQYKSDFSMPIGNARRPGDLNERNWTRFAAAAGLDANMVCEEAFTITGKVAEQYEDLFAQAELDSSRMKTIQKHVRVLRRGLPTSTASAFARGNPLNSARSSTRSSRTVQAPPVTARTRYEEARLNAEHRGGWQAIPPPGFDASEEWTVGRRIRIMPEDGGGLPLWDEEGRLPEEPEFVRDFLGLTQELVDDLLAWSDAIDTNRGIDKALIATEGERLRARLEQELGGDFTVVLVP